MEIAINGRTFEFSADPRTSLLDLLRNHLGLTGSMAGEVERGLPSFVTDDLSAVAVTLDHDEVRERMSGNLCRCGAYNGIVEAITSTIGNELA